MRRSISWRRLVSDYPAFIIPGDTHDYGIGKFYLEGVGSMLEVTELINDDSVDDNPLHRYSRSSQSTECTSTTSHTGGATQAQMAGSSYFPRP